MDAKAAWRKRNPEKVKEMARLYYEKNKERLKVRDATRKELYPNDFSRARHYKYKYGFSLEAYNEMLEKQDNVCAICFQPETSNRNLAVDHCHSTGKVRGLLCVNCNSALGKFKESTELLQTAIKYLNDNK